MATMRAVKFPEAGAVRRQVQRGIPGPEPGEERVQAGAICHCDMLTTEGVLWNT